MSVLKRVAAIGVTVASLAAAPIVLADTAYDNDLGQSSQMTHTVQEQDSRSASQSDGYTKRNNMATSQESEVVDEFRQRNTLGQSDAMSKTRPYRSLITDY